MPPDPVPAQPPDQLNAPQTAPAQSRGWSVREPAPHRAAEFPQVLDEAVRPSQFDPVAPITNVPVATAVPDPPPWERATPPTVKRILMRRLLVVGVLVAVMFAGVGGYALHTQISDVLSGPHPSPAGHTLVQPAEIDNAPLLHTYSAMFADAMETSMRRQGGTDIVSGAYGNSNGGTRLFVVAAQGLHNWDTAGQLAAFTTTVANAAKKSGLTAVASPVAVKTLSGTSYTCQSETVGNDVVSTSAAMCMWDDFDVVGVVFVIPSTDLSNAANSAADTKVAVEH